MFCRICNEKEMVKGKALCEECGDVPTLREPLKPTKWGRFSDRDLKDWVRSSEFWEFLYHEETTLDTKQGVIEMRRRGLIRWELPKVQMPVRVLRALKKQIERHDNRWWLRM